VSIFSYFNIRVDDFAKIADKCFKDMRTQGGISTGLQSVFVYFHEKTRKTAKKVFGQVTF
jgi:hypothetical protein